MSNIKELSLIFIVLTITLVMVLVIETIVLPFTIISFIKKIYGKVNKRISR
jgi:hypothetical protein